ncbi:hypothetical protein NSQ91_02705 [Paenibacillus sp. FSL R7-0048]|jgi:hypothetical protein|uniref:ABC transporter permease n=1 Tax=Paenibacillus odorifer TaxID=189426 RepID=A0ABX3GNJ9_9BACL|nr:hypothetical protein [Paenibacillus odorifer]OMD33946.1 hypothetical protein BSO21_13445 [Paenibacillus odorifer]OMD71449.1 hypothetical protein BSK48_11995 [Paenibacillus odorifer]OMD79397.1 hypothetical protein BSK53_22195 [Paenibacillus odorifer]OMD80617.1 hypothetical protein BSK50_03005 [Paenibacillus odorifer]OMD92456.1 hypothetical protein BSK49_04050 [Paenibacillus odorifer]
MRTLKDSWFMLRSDFRGDKLKILGTLVITVVFMSYLGGLTSLIANDVLGEQDRTMLADFLFLSFIPLLGLTFSRRSMKYWSEDSYTKMLVYLRTLPIPAAVILSRRKLQGVGSFTLNGTLFFVIIYLLGENFRAELAVPSYIAFAITWLGFGFMVSGLYIFIEYLFSGKAYLWLTLLIVVLSWATSFLVTLGGGSLFLYSISYSKEWGLLSPIMWGSLLLGTISVQLFSKWTIHRLKSRNLI